MSLLTSEYKRHFIRSELRHKRENIQRQNSTFLSKLKQSVEKTIKMHAKCFTHRLCKSVFASSVYTHTHTQFISTCSEQGVNSFHPPGAATTLRKRRLRRKKNKSKNETCHLRAPAFFCHLVYMPYNHRPINTALKTCIKDWEKSWGKQHPKSQR